VPAAFTIDEATGKLTYTVSEVVDLNVYVVIAASNGIEAPAKFKTGPIRVKSGCCPDSTQLHYAV